MLSETRLDDLDPRALEDAVRSALARPEAVVADWHASSIHRAFAQGTGGVYRLLGTALDGGDSLPWSLVVKIVRNAQGFDGSTFDDPSSPNYWKREALLHQSGVLVRLPPGIVAPHFYGVTEPIDDTAWIWQEDIVEDCSRHWPISRYGLAARHLGAFNGAYAAGFPLPIDTSLSRGWLRAWVATLLPQLVRIAEIREHPLIRPSWSSALFDRIARIGAEQDLFLSALAGLPRCFCHLDAFRGNLLDRCRPDGSEDTVAVDWSFTGIGVLGEDLAPMVAASVGFGHVEPEHIWELDRCAFEGYTQGLRDAGWAGDPLLARLGYTAAAALRYGIWPYWLAAVDENLARAFEHSMGRPLAEILDHLAIIATYLCDLADEARTLMGDVL